nr:diacylglycerol kinase [Salinicola halimionae]
MAPPHKGLLRIFHATKYSLSGLKQAWQQEAAFRQEVVICALCLPVVLLADVAGLERAMLFGSALLVIIVELINSALEATVDRIGLEHHPLSGSAKDMGSAAVLVSLVLMVGVWLCILL